MANGYWSEKVGEEIVSILQAVEELHDQALHHVPFASCGEDECFTVRQSLDRLLEFVETAENE